ncbi:hypothetical protein [Humibacillus xanthopallidus]|uniref:hypothetical protein n=1 Tax=Humibacillus xanthopallidus TaxID=412689 RepID=UPI00384C4660
MRTLHLYAPARGVWTAEDLDSLDRRCAAISLVLKRQAFSHVTAARLHGLPLPRSLDDEVAIHVLRDARDGAVRRRGLVGHRGLFERDVTDVSGVPVTSLPDTWVDMGELIRPGFALGLDDLVIMGDAVANTLGSVEPLHAALSRRVAPRGKLTLLEALPLVRVGSESPGETRTRLVLTRSGLPEPELNKPVFGPGRLWLGRPDMRWKKHRALLEYQGREFHDGDEQRAKDDVRFARFSAHDWTVVPVWDEDVNTDQARVGLVKQMAGVLVHPLESLDLAAIHPRFFSMRMLELAEIRRRRLKAQGR